MVNLFTISAYGSEFGLGSLKYQTFFIVTRVFCVEMLLIGCRETRVMYDHYPNRHRSDLI